MRRFKQFITANAYDRSLLRQALFWVLVIRIGLCLLPFRVLKKMAGRIQKKSAAAFPAGKCVWAVRATSRCVPAATCLTQALAAQIVLARSGHDSRLEIGVTNNEKSGFQAHAWLVHKNEIVIGASGAEEYVPLTFWDTPIGGNR